MKLLCKRIKKSRKIKNKHCSLILEWEETMLYLNKESISQKEEWEKIDVEYPTFDYQKMIEISKKSPKWVHFGIGNIFRAFLASVEHDILNTGEVGGGIIAVEVHDREILEKVYKPHDNLSILVIMNGDGSIEKKIISSISESLFGDPSDKIDWNRLQEIFSSPTLQMASFTITEKGYSIKNFDNELLPEVKWDMQNGIENPRSMMGKLVSLMYTRFKAGKYPISLVSMDNLARNGEKLQHAVRQICEQWVNDRLVEKEFLDYMDNEKKVAFPWTMIDKITPRPAKSVENKLSELGMSGNEIVITAKDTHIAAFVNAEKPQYLVIEDKFPNAHPPLQNAGVIFTDRKTVEKTDKMKVCTCLNPLMTTLAVFGCVLGYTLMADEMKDPYLNRLVRKIGYDEGMKVVADPKVINPKDFIDEAVHMRLTNVYMPDTPQRVATDTSQKVNRFGETIKSYAKRTDLDEKTLTYIPLAIAGWCRYLMGVDDNNKTFKLSTDPMLSELCSYVSKLEVGKPETVGDNLKPILSNKRIFGADLYEMGLGEKIEGFVQELIKEQGAVRATLEKYLK
jgi:fructuronate reductase